MKSSFVFALLAAFLSLYVFPAHAFVLTKGGHEVVRAHSVSGKKCRIDEVGSHFYIRACNFR